MVPVVPLTGDPSERAEKGDTVSEELTVSEALAIFHLELSASSVAGSL